ncbi:MAG: Beta-1,3-glucosyltransferase [Burkholderiaceae bacterium]|jgi:GT2 family glycosyltransferase|nr:MAG: Beta-1,3-glucosyltransferase [Burkholderiaceae bacterium]
MKFSVVIPLFNKAPYVGAAIDSVLAQSVDDFEIVVVDDGSTDRGAEVVQAIADPRVRLIRQENGGVSAARNRGIEASRGEWVAFLDADDWHHPRHLATLLLAQQAYPEADTVACDYVYAPHSETDWPPRWQVADDSPAVERITDLPSRWFRGPSLFTSAVAVRSSRLRSMQPCFPPGESYGEDLDLWFRLAEKAPIALAHAPTVAYRAKVAGSLAAGNLTLPMPPWIDRMRERARSGALTPAQSRSALRLLAQFDVTRARKAVATGERREGLRRLFRGRRAANSLRWWLTLSMALLVPGHLVEWWQTWRVNRSRPALEAADGGVER